LIEDGEKDPGKGRRWAVTLLYTLLIFVFLPVFPTVWGALSGRWPGTLKGVTYGLPMLLLVLFLGHRLLIRRLRDPLFYVLVLSIALVYGLLLGLVCRYPAERFHLVEYGGLVFLVHWSLTPPVRMGFRMGIRTGIRTARIYLVILLYTFAVGLADELIQALLPNRIYDIKDVVINWVASLLATALLMTAAWRR